MSQHTYFLRFLAQRLGEEVIKGRMLILFEIQFETYTLNFFRKKCCLVSHILISFILFNILAYVLYKTAPGHHALVNSVTTYVLAARIQTFDCQKI